MSDSRYKIYLDMDGVICDWVNQFERYSGAIAPELYERQYGKRRRYQLVYNNSPKFYADMAYMPDALQLLEYLKNYDVQILSHATDDRAAEGKLDWLKKHNIVYNPILVNKSEDKANFADKNYILIDDKPENIKQFRDAGGKAILHKNAANTINQLKQLEANSLNESSYRLYNSVLNPDIWNSDGTIKSDVASALMNIARVFYKDTELDAPIEDVYLLGSAAAYNWTPTSDLDLHIVVDFKKINKDADLVNAYTNLLKAKWNKDHDIVVNNHPVEVYIQDVDHKTHSLGTYSVKNNKWIKKPKYDEPKFDKEAIKKKYKEMKVVIDDAVSNGDYKKIEKLIKKIYDYRQSGLDKKGEFATENIVFKLLRNAGYIEKLKIAVDQLKDKKLSKV